MVSVEFWSKEKTHECMWKELADITYWKLSYILASQRMFQVFFFFLKQRHTSPINKEQRKILATGASLHERGVSSEQMYE